MILRLTAPSLADSLISFSVADSYPERHSTSICFCLFTLIVISFTELSSYFVQCSQDFYDIFFTSPGLALGYHSPVSAEQATLISVCSCSFAPLEEIIKMFTHFVDNYICS